MKKMKKNVGRYLVGGVCVLFVLGMLIFVYQVIAFKDTISAHVSELETRLDLLVEQSGNPPITIRVKKAGKDGAVHEVLKKYAIDFFDTKEEAIDKFYSCNELRREELLSLDVRGEIHKKETDNVDVKVYYYHHDLENSRILEGQASVGEMYSSNKEYSFISLLYPYIHDPVYNYVYIVHVKYNNIDKYIAFKVN